MGAEVGSGVGSGVGAGVGSGVGSGVDTSAGTDTGASSSAMVVVTEEAPRVGDGPPPPARSEMDTVKVSPVPSSRVSSVVRTVMVLVAASAGVKVSVPDVDA